MKGNQLSSLVQFNLPKLGHAGWPRTTDRANGRITPAPGAASFLYQSPAKPDGFLNEYSTTIKLDLPSMGWLPTIHYT